MVGGAAIFDRRLRGGFRGGFGALVQGGEEVFGVLVVGMGADAHEGLGLGLGGGVAGVDHEGLVEGVAGVGGFAAGRVADGAVEVDVGAVGEFFGGLVHDRGALGEHLLEGRAFGGGGSLGGGGQVGVDLGDESSASSAVHEAAEAVVGLLGEAVAAGALGHGDESGPGGGGFGGAGGAEEPAAGLGQLVEVEVDAGGLDAGLSPGRGVGGGVLEVGVEAVEGAVVVAELLGDVGGLALEFGLVGGGGDGFEELAVVFFGVGPALGGDAEAGGLVSVGVVDLAEGFEGLGGGGVGEQVAAESGGAAVGGVESDDFGEGEGGVVSAAGVDLHARQRAEHVEVVGVVGGEFGGGVDGVFESAGGGQGGGAEQRDVGALLSGDGVLAVAELVFQGVQREAGLVSAESDAGFQEAGLAAAGVVGQRLLDVVQRGVQEVGGQREPGVVQGRLSVGVAGGGGEGSGGGLGSGQGFHATFPWRRSDSRRWA